MKKIIISVLFVVILIIVFSCNLDVSGRTFYVSSYGNDAANGRTPATAWKTINKVNSSSFSPGDSILFKRGDTWSLIDENDSYGLIADNSGTNGKRIVYSAYGSGARPVITAKHSITAWNIPVKWTRNGNVWHMTFPNYGPKRLWLSGIEAMKHPNESVNASEVWYWGSNVLYIYSATNPATTFSNMEHTGTSVINNVITITANFITFQNLDIRGGWLNMVISGADNCIIEECDIGHDSGAMGIFISGKGSKSGHSDKGIIRNCTFDSYDQIMDSWEAENTNDGLHLRDGVHDWEIFNNTFINWGHSAFKAITYDAAYTVSDILFYNNLVTAPDCDMGRGIDISGIAGCMSGIEIYKNLIYDIPVENQIDAPDVRFYDNIIDKVRGLSYLYGYPGNAGGIVIFGSDGLKDDPSNIQIYNNSIINCRDAGIIIDNSGAAIKKNNYIQNNILYNNDTDGDPDNRANHYQLYIYHDVATIGPHTFQNNLVYSPANDQTVYYGRATGNYNLRHLTIKEFNAYNGTGGDKITNNIFGDPLFIDASNGDYQLKTGSPAIGAGIHVGSKNDQGGILLPIPPDIGTHSPGTYLVYPVYINSSVTNDAPDILEIVFSCTLANIVPSPSAFTILINSVKRRVLTAYVSKQKVQLKLERPVLKSDIVTVSYEKPIINALQISPGREASSFITKSVINKVGF